ncbi:hypothetical protein [Achromobacter sp. Marseille-Q0513]|uniref:hypothetical protein n=1 Tax=Achromobacter sp. Marseille-Q0513 TaxID=2829161 RepID=UPI0032C45C47
MRILVYVNDMDVAGGAYFASQPGSQGGGHIAATDERNRKFVFHNGRIVNRHVPGKKMKNVRSRPKRAI